METRRRTPSTGIPVVLTALLVALVPSPAAAVAVPHYQRPHAGCPPRDGVRDRVTHQPDS